MGEGKKMNVAMWYRNNDVRLEEMDIPVINAHEMLVRVEASGICGSDGMEWYRLHKAPLVLGHEVAGTIVELGSAVNKTFEARKSDKRFCVGDRVSVAHHVPCNTCHYCLQGHQAVCKTLQSTNFDPGGFTQYLRVPAINVDRGVFKIPDGVSLEDATFIEPLGCVIRGLRQANLEPGNSVMVVGCGISGQLMIMAARAMGAGRIYALDTIPFRLEMAKKHGANEVIDSDEGVGDKLRHLNGGMLADRVVICRAKWIPQALDAVEKGGTVLFFAGARADQKIDVPVNDLFWKTEITLTSSYAAPPADSMQAMALIHSGAVPVNSMITHRQPLGALGEGIRMLVNPTKFNSMKTVVYCQE